MDSISIFIQVERGIEDSGKLIKNMSENHKLQNKEGKNCFKLNKTTIKRLEEAFSLDASIVEACYYANISTQTYYNWIEWWPMLKEKFDRLRQKPILKARETVVKSLQNPDYAFKYLKAKRKEEFSEQQKIDHTTQGEKVVGFNFIKPNETNNTDNSSNDKTE